MPWSVALLVALMVACAAVGLPLYGCAMEIQALTQQEEFMGNLTQVRTLPNHFQSRARRWRYGYGEHCGQLWACVGPQLRDEIRGTLLDEGYVIMDLEPELVVTNTTLTFADIMSSSEPVRTILSK